MKRFIFIILAALSLLFFKMTLDQIPDASGPQTEEIVQWARAHLPQTGVLKEDRGGFVYLKVDDGYINQLFPRLSDPGYVKPS